MRQSVERVDVGGLTIAYRRAGSGPPLLLLHGGPLDSREWRRQLEGLSDEFTVIAPDLPGSGGSSDPPESFRPRDYADVLAAFIKAIELKRPHLLGLSFGSVLALEFYRWYPKVPRTLILASAYAGWAGSLSPAAVEERKKHVFRLIEERPETFAREWMPTLMTESASASMIDEVRAILVDFHPSGQRVTFGAFADADLRDVLPTIRVPTLLLYGDKDVRSPLAIAEELHAKIPGSKLVVIPGVGHLADIEGADRFNDAVLRFLRSVQN